MKASSQQAGFPALTAPGQRPIVNSIFDFSDDALNELRLWLEIHPPATSISSILGFSQFTVQTSSDITNSDTTSSTSYTDLTHAGPELTGLPDGKYIVLFKCVSNTDTAGDAAIANVSVNGDTPADDSEAVINFSTSAVTGMSWAVKTLNAGGANTVKMVYRSNAALATATFSFRQLAALRYSNL